MAILMLLLVAFFHHNGCLVNAWAANNVLMTGPKAYLTYTSSVQVGAQAGMEECKHQFAWDRWNCPESAIQLKGLRSATRETSFVHAISAAGVMYTLTRNCSMGDLENCGCDDSKNGKIGGTGWLWGGCSDNADFGETISKQYVDALETGQDYRAAINLHNNEAGRLAVKATMKRVCRCHGMSESCSVKTCWMQVSDFRAVGDHLRAKHEQARRLKTDNRKTKHVETRSDNSADSALPGRGRGGGTAAVDALIGGVAATELLYLEESPDYCARNDSLGLRGTEGRECVLHGGEEEEEKEEQRDNQHYYNGREKRSCRRLCQDCGLRVEARRVEVVSSCNCKFHWCCTVQCEDCTQVRVKHYCSKRDPGQVYRRRPLRGGHRRAKGSSVNDS